MLLKAMGNRMAARELFDIGRSVWRGCFCFDDPIPVDIGNHCNGDYAIR
jgi:hypothetical protein